MNPRDFDGAARYENDPTLDPARRQALMVAHWRIEALRVRNT